MLGTLPERLCCGYPSLNDIISSGKRKDLRSIGHPLKFLLSLLCPLQLLGAEAAQNLQASRAWCRELVLAGKETQELLLMWMGREHFQNLTEEVCRWGLIVMEKSISFSYWPRTDLHLAKSVVKVSWHLYPETLVLMMASFLHTHWWQHWYQKGKVAPPGSPGRVGGSVFVDKHGDAWESAKKSGSWSPRTERAPALKERRRLVAGEEEFVIGEKFKPALMSSWRERISF